MPHSSSPFRLRRLAVALRPVVLGAVAATTLSLGAGVATADVTYKASSSAANGSGGAQQKAVSVARPSGSASGDLLLAQVVVRNTDTLTAPAGWTEVTREVSGGMQQAVYRRARAASEPSTYEWSWATNADATATILVYTGYDGTTPVIVEPAQTGATTSPFVSNTLTSAPAGGRTVGLVGISQSGALSIGTSVSPSGTAVRQSRSTNSAPGSRVSSMAVDRVIAATGATTAFSWTTTSNSVSGSIAQQIAVQPGPAGGDTSGGNGDNADSGGTGGKSAAPDNRPRPRVTLCHATKSATNPYVVITVDPNSVITQGHDQHQDGRDIIPAFTYEEKGQVISYPGKNLTPANLVLLANGCRAAAQTSVTAALLQSAKAPKKTRVTLCHATRSATNPYVRITVAPEAVYREGHDQHQDGRDIIPPFAYEVDGTTQQYPGKNWDAESQAIFNNGCKPLRPETGPASTSATVTFCAALGGGQYVRTSATVAEVLQRPAGGDIIPPFTYTSSGTKSFAGANWTAASQSILDAGCVAPILTTPTAPVEPVVTCINLNEDGSFSAVFGYRNPNAVPVSQPVGASNAIALDEGAEGAVVGAQPTRFMAGSLEVAVTVTGIGPSGSVTWTIAAPGEARTATATTASPQCTAPAFTPEISVRAECVIDQGNGTYAARFGYQSNETSTVPVPVGPLNTLTQSAGGAVGQVQAASFAPGLNASAFTVTGIRSRNSVTWRVVTGATTRTATASLATVPSCFAPAPPPPGSTPTSGGPTSDGEVPPYQVPNPGPGGNVTCEQLGYSATSGRINFSDAGFTQSFARQGLTVGVAGGTYVTWTSTFPVGAVIVKGGPRANVYQYTPGRFGDAGLASPVNASGNPAGLSNLTICWNPGAPGFQQMVRLLRPAGLPLAFTGEASPASPKRPGVYWYTLARGPPFTMTAPTGNVEVHVTYVPPATPTVRPWRANDCVKPASEKLMRPLVAEYPSCSHVTLPPGPGLGTWYGGTSPSDVGPPEVGVEPGGGGAGAKHEGTVARLAVAVRVVAPVTTRHVTEFRDRMPVTVKAEALRPGAKLAAWTCPTAPPADWVSVFRGPTGTGTVLVSLLW